MKTTKQFNQKIGPLLRFHYAYQILECNYGSQRAQFLLKCFVMDELRYLLTSENYKELEIAGFLSKNMCEIVRVSNGKN